MTPGEDGGGLLQPIKLPRASAESVRDFARIGEDLAQRNPRELNEAERRALADYRNYQRYAGGSR